MRDEGDEGDEGDVGDEGDEGEKIQMKGIRSTGLNMIYFTV